ncbi:uncharacterized protein Asalp_20850 [Aeromonas salmonicida subsp. pectinolytica 34mel]|uniref:Uncharacterized protein n=1 Tax=Aeromonas salmonicida subsp. pectinolytica 34mel TaxID=1324960 RepID=A0A2D1QFU2_AERSA|nr:uncharacterized protein Asalp_20850 [Aeromonas salmonicida subsp. pectinolytica 34mel]
MISPHHLPDELVKLLQIPSPTESTNKSQHINIKCCKNKNFQSNHQFTPHIYPHSNILL